MKQYDLDALGMRLERISNYLAETACLIRIWADIENNAVLIYIAPMPRRLPALLLNI